VHEAWNRRMSGIARQPESVSSTPRAACTRHPRPTLLNARATSRPALIAATTAVRLEHRIIAADRVREETTSRPGVGPAFRDAVPIEWRQPAGAIADHPASAQVRLGQDAASAQVPEPARAHPQVVAPVVPPAQQAPAAAAWNVEGPMMDRLAENVMQRIERRMRIERERRGM
jgi:hypothetical protein